MSTKDQALTEFREASAAVRRAFSAHFEAREAQILANRNAADTSEALLMAQDRLDRADQMLQEAKADAPAPAAIDAAKGLTGSGAGPVTGQGEMPKTAAEFIVQPNGAAGTTHVADPAEQGIG